MRNLHFYSFPQTMNAKCGFPQSGYGWKTLAYLLPGKGL